MANSKDSRSGRRTEKLWLPSVLLVAQFLTITPVLLIVFANEQQRRASDGYLTLLDSLDRLSFAIADLENVPRAGAKQQYSYYQDALNRVLSMATPSPEVRETLARADSMVTRMATTAKPESGQEDGRAARSELLNAQRLVRSQLSTSADTIAQQTIYLKALVAGACLLAFGVVLVVRRFRVDAAIQSNLQQELRTTNEEVIAALASARSESQAKNQFLEHVGQLMRIESGEKLRNLASQIADYARLESGKFELQSTEFEPARIVTDVVQFFMPSANRKHLTLRSSIEEGLPSVVRGDPERLRQVLANLVSNALRFTEKGEILLRVAGTISAEEMTGLRFEVRDSGSGLAEPLGKRIFQPFSTLHNANSSGGNEGNGLGLAISKKLVELMGGRIDVVSEPGRGCTFSFTAVFENSRRASGVGSTSPANSKLHTDKKSRRERRAEQRHGANYPTLLRAEMAGIAVIRVLDVSSSGLRVSVPFRLIPRTEVEIRIEGTSVVGIVRNCACISPNEFHVGIHIPREASADEQERLNHLSLLRIVRAVDSDEDLDEEDPANLGAPGSPEDPARAKGGVGRA